MALAKNLDAWNIGMLAEGLSLVNRLEAAIPWPLLTCSLYNGLVDIPIFNGVFGKLEQKARAVGKIENSLLFVIFVNDILCVSGFEKIEDLFSRCHGLFLYQRAGDARHFVGWNLGAIRVRASEEYGRGMWRNCGLFVSFLWRF